MKAKEGETSTYDIIDRTLQSTSAFQSPAGGSGGAIGQASEDDSMWSTAHGLHSGPRLGAR